MLQVDASATERTAAEELRQYIRQISGVELPVIQGNAPQHIDSDSLPHSINKHIYVGWNPSCGQPRPHPTDEGFTYRTVGDDLYIYGGSDRGTMYGVFTFLERELGVHWYTSSYTHVPRMKRYALPTLDHSEQPALRQRLDFCYDALRHREWAAHNRMNDMHRMITNRYGTFQAIWGIHTFYMLIPPEVYFAEHPEYFSLIKGERSDKSQLCLSNDGMRRQLTENLLTTIRENPGYWCYDVSQNDNRLDCECEECMRLTEQYGSRSGALLWFVNQVADDVAREFPDIYISTFAYHTTRLAPMSGNITPADNVVIRLCATSCCMSHPLAQCPEDKSFLEDFNNWLLLTPNIYIWDYACSFYHYLLPFPNYQALAANYRLFSEARVIGVMEEGAHDAPWAEFSELKQWVIARLLWNPYQDVDSLVSLFINDYYGKAASFILQYYNLCKDRGTHHHLTVKVTPSNPIYDGDFIASAEHLLTQALSATDDKETLRRVKRIAAQIYYLQMQRDRKQAKARGIEQKFKDIIAEDSTYLREGKYTAASIFHFSD